MPSRGGRQGAFLAPDQLTITYGDASARIARGTGADWFGPLDPLKPIAPPEVASRQWDFPSGFNLNATPRVDAPITFATLRGLADAYDLLRLIIETRKDQIARMRWSIKPRDETATNANDPALRALSAFFKRPDGVHGFSDWLRLLLEDLFVIDAPALYMQRDRAGRLIALLPLDGATIKPVIDDWGRTPQPFAQDGALVYPTAYQQILKGYPALDYSTRDLLYRPRNIRSHCAYGYSPVEQIITTVGIALRRQISTLEYYTSGNIPDSLIGVPETWTPDQIANYQKYWDAYIEGDLGRRRKAKFVPGGVAKTFIQTKEPELKSEFDDWLARLCCFAFSVSPQALVKQMNRASADTQKELAEEEGLWPILDWVKTLIDDVIEREFGAPQFEFAWGQDQQIDAAQQATVLSTYVKAGVLTINEARQKLGEQPLADPAANRAMTLTASGYQPIGAGLQGVGVAGVAPRRQVIKFNVDELRVPKHHDGGGQWTREGSADADVTPAATIVTPQGFTHDVISGPDLLDPKKLNTPISVDEQQKIANALTVLLNGGGYALQPHHYKNLPHITTGAVLPPSVQGYAAYDVPGFSSHRGVHRLLVDKDNGTLYYTNNHYMSFYLLHWNLDAE